MKHEGAEHVRRSITRHPFVAILPGESLIEYLDLVDRLAGELRPRSLLQWDALYTIANAMWHKQRRQRFTAAKLTSAMFDPEQPAYDEAMVLNATLHILLNETEEREIEQTLGRLSKNLRDCLLRECPPGKFKRSKAWARAMARNIEKELLPAARRFGQPPAEVLMARSAGTMSDETFIRDLETEERLDARIDRAYARFFKLRAIEDQTTFTELRRSFLSGVDRTSARAKRSTPRGARA
jgi:hypothetical protein